MSHHTTSESTSTGKARSPLFLVAVLTAAFLWGACSKGPTFQGRNADEWLKLLKTSSSETSPLSVDCANAVFESGCIKFEVPISFDMLQDNRVMNRIGNLTLYVDGRPESHCARGSNGNCVIAWNISDTSHGKHTLQLSLVIGNRSGGKQLVINGPSIDCFSQNTVRLDPFYSVFNHSKGAFLQARLFQVEAKYEVDLFHPEDPDGKKLKTFLGRTTNGAIKEWWNLTNVDGRAFTGQIITAVFKVAWTNGSSATVTQILERINE